VPGDGWWRYIDPENGVKSPCVPGCQADFGTQMLAESNEILRYVRLRHDHRAK